tara:strand:- start:615 stop:785 length:171 start_codon:yes stop_codon:yes gene_type:complete
MDDNKAKKLQSKLNSLLEENKELKRELIEMRARYEEACRLSHASQPDMTTLVFRDG